MRVGEVYLPLLPWAPRRPDGSKKDVFLVFYSVLDLWRVPKQPRGPVELSDTFRIWDPIYVKSWRFQAIRILGPNFFGPVKINILVPNFG
mgnify:CR=1 FL=1